MSNALAVSQTNGAALHPRLPNPNIVPRSSATVEFVRDIEAYWRLANMLVQSGMVPVKKPEAAMAIMLKAHELGIPAMHAFANIHFFDGKLVEAAALMVGMAAENCGVTYEVVEWTDQRCELLFRRPGWAQPLPSSFSMEDADRAGLTRKDNWKKYPKAMLLARAQAQGVRAIAPDRFAGHYSREEIEDVAEQTQRLSAQNIAAALDAGDDAPPTVIESTPAEPPADAATQDRKLTQKRELFGAALQEKRPDLVENEFDLRFWLETVVGESDPEKLTSEQLTKAIGALERGEGPAASEG